MSVIEHTPILTIVMPLTFAFLIPILTAVKKESKIPEVLALVGSLCSLVFSVIVAYAIWSVGKPIVYTLGADIPTIVYRNQEFPVRILLEIDRLSALLGILVAFEVFIATIFSWGYIRDPKRKDKYYTLMLLSLVGMLGILYTGDLFNLYVFLEILAISSYALVAFEYEHPEALEAAMKYLVLGSISSTFILVGIAIIYGEFDSLTMAMVAKLIDEYGMTISLVIAYALFTMGALLKAGVAPMHMWLIDAHPSAPSPFSAVLSGVIVKVAIYIFLRITFSVFGLTNIDTTSVGIIIVGLAAISLTIAPIMATAQRDVKRLFAYSTVTELGYIMMGIGVFFLAPLSVHGVLAIEGSVFHIINHAIYKGLLFLVSGSLIVAIGTRDLTKMSNIAKKMPYTTIALIIGLFSIIGLPPLNGFASKWLIIESSFAYSPVTGLFVILGSALTFAYMMKVVLSLYAPGGKEPSGEVGASMVVPVIMMAIICIVIGLLAAQILNKVIVPSIESLISRSEYINAVFNYKEAALNWSGVKLL